jgi:type II secretory ATPase GspE/PulE/Tfp pilus assembly ATPase PilB-like protein
VQQHDDEIRELIVDRVHQTQLRERSRAKGMRTLQDAVCDMVDHGQTTIAEAMRTVYVI